MISAVRLYNRFLLFREEKRHILLSEGIFSYILSNKGYVLIIVLIVSVLLIAVSTGFLYTSQTNSYFITRIKNDLQAEEIAKAGVVIGSFILDADKDGRAGSIIEGINSPVSIDSYGDLWAVQFPQIPVEDGLLEISIHDEQSKINISIITNEFGSRTEYYHIAESFFQNMGFQHDIIDCIYDWVDSDDTRSSQGAETFDYYSTLSRPYKAKNGPLDSIDELLMVKGITPELFYGRGGGFYAHEEGLVTDNMFLDGIDPDHPGTVQKDDEVLNSPIGPESDRSFKQYLRGFGDRMIVSDLNKININTAPYRVISALTGSMTPDKVTELIRRRKTTPFASVSDAMGIINDPNFPNVANALSVSSSIFTIETKGTFKGSVVTINAVYERGSGRFLYYGIQ